jgi:hypothetical protein
MESLFFPPKYFYLIIWLFTLVIVLLVLVSSSVIGIGVYIFITFGISAIFQLWQIVWVKIDSINLTIKNIFGNKRVIKWDDLVNISKETVNLKRSKFEILHIKSLSNKKYKITSDQSNFELLEIELFKRIKIDNSNIKY